MKLVSANEAAAWPNETAVFLDAAVPPPLKMNLNAAVPRGHGVAVVADTASVRADIAKLSPQKGQV